MKKYGLSTMFCIVLVFCAAAVIASPAQILTTLVSFDGTNGKDPESSLVQANDGNFYGTTVSGGASNRGTVFKVTPSGTLTTLYSFNLGADGFFPASGLVQATDGNFYGTAANGGANNNGTVFKITPSGTLTTLHRFSGTDGATPWGGLAQGIDGNFYGTTYYGGAKNLGTVFTITPSGTLTTLYSFSGGDGGYPSASLIQAYQDDFYGTTTGGGAYHDGTVFKITPSGTLTTLYSFSGSDGANPWASLIRATDGYFYGTTYEGGAYGGGTVFKITRAGKHFRLYSFSSGHGLYPMSSLIQANDGNFYGTTYEGGTGNICGADCGTVFSITSKGTLTTLYSFSGADGATPVGGLVQGSDGNFYGTTDHGGANNDGTVFTLHLPLQLVTVAPCRLVDTRQNQGGGTIQAGTFEVFNLHQLAQTQGCADLSSAGAYSLNVTLVPQNGKPVNYLTIWPGGTTQPYVSTMNSDGRFKANAAIVPSGVSGAVSVYVTDTSDVVLDIDGYFSSASDSTLAFYPLPPCRVADTRNPRGDLGGPYLKGGVPRNFPVLEASSCNIPNTAEAYSLNFTAVPHGYLNYLTVWPTGQTQPYVSTLNAPTGTVVANGAIVPAGTGGEISTFAYNDTDLVIDIDGYFAPTGAGGLSLYPAAPCRVLDTRNENGAFSGTLSPSVDVLGSVCAPPKQSQAYVFNATVVPSGPLGYLTLWPDGQTQPYVSTLNAYDGVVTSNMAIVPAGTGGKIDAYAYGLTQLILDISSYFAP